MKRKVHSSQTVVRAMVLFTTIYHTRAPLTMLPLLRKMFWCRAMVHQVPQVLRYSVQYPLAPGLLVDEGIFAPGWTTLLHQGLRYSAQGRVTFLLQMGTPIPGPHPKGV